MAFTIHKRYIVHPHKFVLWLAIVSAIMIFAAFTSAYVVKKGDTKAWQDIALPHIFTISTMVIVCSSLFMHAAYLSFIKGKLMVFRSMMLLTFLTGATFLILQIMGWIELTGQGVNLKGNVAGSFIYVISGAHFVHVLGGVIALLIFSVITWTKYSTASLMDPETYSARKTGVEIMMTYWHFVDFLWVYLFFFFILNR
ncbi:MAG: cytochrome c oxidase subunit 3 [Chitinophagales bacterium]